MIISSKSIMWCHLIIPTLNFNTFLSSYYISQELKRLQLLKASSVTNSSIFPIILSVKQVGSRLNKNFLLSKRRKDGGALPIQTSAPPGGRREVRRERVSREEDAAVSSRWVEDDPETTKEPKSEPNPSLNLLKTLRGGGERRRHIGRHIGQSRTGLETKTYEQVSCSFSG